nr:hypothetical protein [Tanacetum cinerariifolium]
CLVKEQDDKTKKEAKGKSLVESFTRYRDLSAEFEDCSDNSINKVNVVDASQLLDDPDMPELEDITYSDDEDDVAEILRKFGLTKGKSASTHIDTEKPLLKDPDGEDVDVHTYRSMISSLMHLTSSRPDIMFAVSCKKQIVVATSSTEAEYVAAASCCVDDLSNHKTKYTSAALTQKVFANMRRVGKGFYEVETPLFEGMLVEQKVDEEGDVDEHVEEVNTGDAAEGDDRAVHEEVPIVTKEPSIPSPTPPQPPQDIPLTSYLLQEAMDAYVALTRRVKNLEYDKVAQALEITKLKRRVKKLEIRNKVRVLKLRRLQKVGTSQRVETFDDTMMDDESNQGRMIAERDQDDDVVLKDDKKEDKKVVDAVKDVKEAKVDESAQDQGRQEDETEPAEVLKVVDVVTIAKLITKVVSAAKETPNTASAIITTAEAQVPLATLIVAHVRVVAAPSRRRKGVVIRDPKSESTTSTIIAAKTKFKDKDKRAIKEDENKALQKINETLAERAAKRRKLDKEVEELSRHLQIVPNEDDYVYTEATLLARKVPVVNYRVIEINNKPYYKIIRADDIHQLYISFLSLLRNLDREYLEAL